MVTMVQGAVVSALIWSFVMVAFCWEGINFYKYLELPIVAKIRAHFYRNICHSLWNFLVTPR